jgi:glyoxylase-like metal-dependent hydrolase (beta-lactamase superfamily II)
MASVWDEVGDDCFRRRYESFDLNIGVVRGADGFLVIDTRCNRAEALELLDELRQLGSMPVRRIVNSHDHFDHHWGNATIRSEYPGVEIWAHAKLAEPDEASAARARKWLRDVRPEWTDLATIEVVPPDHVVVEIATIDLGNRAVEVRSPGRGHTDNDLVVVVSDAGVVFAGDIVVESAPPAYGHDSFPLEWPATNAQLLEWIQADATVVPGHGDVVDRAFVARQLGEIEQIADTIRALHATGVPEADALAHGDWPWDRDRLRDAVRRGYHALA